ncbi:GNAT family N-acetyltransferase [Devriesea agamarum]|uniref:GNAT family N-acetyltransferase n=1 Tax=Devriesea agamarum TaxID=472569 RepID=UPI00071D5CBA|nr:DUF4081 domain-containing GNAT family N-acetyltransferase [Devriesea agamarum]
MNVFGRSYRGMRPLRPTDVDPALEIAAYDPATTVLAASRLRDMRRSLALGQEFTVWTGAGLMTSARDILAYASRSAASRTSGRGIGAWLWHGANAMPVGADREAMAAFGECLAARGRHCSSLVGNSSDVRELFGHLESVWDRPREFRWSQPLLEALQPPSVLPDPRLRPARPEETDVVMAASVAMFREEVGSDPTEFDGGRSYRARVRSLIAARRTYVIMDGNRVAFKADVGALIPGLAQLHGIWVAPRLRGRHIARTGVAAVIDWVRRDHARRVTLYVNDFNLPARRAYDAAGLRQIGELATILF